MFTTWSVCTTLYLCTVFWIPKNMSEVFKTLYRHPISHLFLSMFLVSLLFASITGSGSYDIQQLPPTVFHKLSQGKGCFSCVISESGQILKCLISEYFVDILDMSNNDNSLVMGLWEKLNIVQTPAVDATLLVSTVIVERYFLSLKQNYKDRDGNRQV